MMQRDKAVGGTAGPPGGFITESVQKQGHPAFAADGLILQSLPGSMTHPQEGYACLLLHSHCLPCSKGLKGPKQTAAS